MLFYFICSHKKKGPKISNFTLFQTSILASPSQQSHSKLIVYQTESQATGQWGWHFSPTRERKLLWDFKNFDFWMRLSLSVSVSVAKSSGTSSNFFKLRLLDPLFLCPFALLLFTGFVVFDWWFFDRFFPFPQIKNHFMASGSSWIFEIVAWNQFPFVNSSDGSSRSSHFSESLLLKTLLGHSREREKFRVWFDFGQ